MTATHELKLTVKIDQSDLDFVLRDLGIHGPLFAEILKERAGWVSPICGPIPMLSDYTDVIRDRVIQASNDCWDNDKRGEWRAAMVWIAAAAMQAVADWDLRRAVAAVDVPPACEPAHTAGRRAVELAYTDGQPVHFRDAGKPDNPWYAARPHIADHGFLWATYEYRSDTKHPSTYDPDEKYDPFPF